MRLGKISAQGRVSTLSVIRVFQVFVDYYELNKLRMGARGVYKRYIDEDDMDYDEEYGPLMFSAFKEESPPRTTGCCSTSQGGPLNRIEKCRR